MEQNTHLKQTKLERHLFFGWFFTQEKRQTLENVARVEKEAKLIREDSRWNKGVR